MCVYLVTYITVSDSQFYVGDLYVEEAFSKGIQSCVCVCVCGCVSVGVYFSSWC